MSAVLFVLWSYSLGALPFGVWISRAKGVDIMRAGSGNIGATNVVRAIGAPGYLVFLLDVLKGYVPAAAAANVLDQQGYSSTWAIVCGIAAVLGHMYSPAIGFRGGKGIATSLGFIIAATPLVALCGFGLFLILLLAFRWVSFASLVAAASLPLFAIVFGFGPTTALVYSGLALLSVYRHRSNIQRLLKGAEPKFSLNIGRKPDSKME
jgi:glycerol-3-phosphate acyltransferase PlsY